MPSADIDQQAAPHIARARREPPQHVAGPSVDHSTWLAISVHHVLPALVVEVAGELDMLTAPRLLATLHAVLRERSPVVVVDLTGIEFMGSAGLAVLVEAHQHAGAHTSLRIVAPGRATLLPIQVTGLDSTLNLYPSRPDALAE